MDGNYFFLTAHSTNDCIKGDANARIVHIVRPDVRAIFRLQKKKKIIWKGKLVWCNCILGLCKRDLTDDKTVSMWYIIKVCTNINNETNFGFSERGKKSVSSWYCDTCPPVQEMHVRFCIFCVPSILVGTENTNFFFFRRELTRVSFSIFRPFCSLVTSFFSLSLAKFRFASIHNWVKER